MKNIYKLLIVALIASIVVTSPVSAQDTQEPNRISIGLLGGVTKGHMNIGTELDPTFGFNLRYAANPTVAFQTNFGFGTFNSTEDDGFDGNGNYYDRQFENSYFTTSLTGQFNLLRLLGGQNERINLYALAGLGMIFNDVETSMGNSQLNGSDDYIGEDHSENAFFATFGTGMRFNLGRRVDLFVQYDYNIANNDIIDGFRTRPEGPIDLHRRNQDHWSSLTGGLQIKLGGSDRDADWHTYRPWASAADIEGLSQRIDDLDSRVQDHEGRISNNEDMIQALSDRMDQMEDRLANLEQLVEDLDRVEVTMDSDVLFAFDSSTIRENAKPTLANVVRALARNPEKNISVTGHTCDIGATDYNQGLSERRANSVRQYLIDAGIDGNRITTQGYGETQPLVPNESNEARQLNRRVELVIE